MTGQRPKRKRLRLVPEDAVEVMEVRIALFFTDDGSRHVAACVGDPDHSDLEHVDMVELMGTIDAGRRYLRNEYGAEDD